MATTKIKGINLYYKKIQKTGVSFTSGFGDVSFKISDYLPSGAKFINGTLTSAPNGYYIQGNVVTDSTNIVLKYQNTHTQTLSGICELTVFYTI